MDGKASHFFKLKIISFFNLTNFFFVRNNSLANMMEWDSTYEDLKTQVKKLFRIIYLDLKQG